MASQKDLMLRGEPYLSDDPDLAAERLRCRLLLERLNSASASDPAAIGRILRELLGAFAETPTSSRRCTATTATRSASARAAS